MRRVRYQVAATLDGFIAGPRGDYDWIVPSDFDFEAHFAQFDTFLMGRKTWEVAVGGPPISGQVVVFSRTLKPEDHPDLTIVAEDAGGAVRALRARPGKDIWLFGGGELFRSLLELGEVDTVEAAPAGSRSRTTGSTRRAGSRSSNTRSRATEAPPSGGEGPVCLVQVVIRSLKLRSSSR